MTNTVPQATILDDIPKEYGKRFAHGGVVYFKVKLKVSSSNLTNPKSELVPSILVFAIVIYLYFVVCKMWMVGFHILDLYGSNTGNPSPRAYFERISCRWIEHIRGWRGSKQDRELLGIFNVIESS